MTGSTKPPAVRHLHPARNAAHRIAELEAALQAAETRALRLERELADAVFALQDATLLATRRKGIISELQVELANRADYADYQAGVLDRMLGLRRPAAGPAQ